mmetsp:Transcript_43530/g.86508  ORF Transcript_43530/g.86508 Transcript_43530/m.86508 type:complete len:390 (+) Transcript_43530:122-1291(+)
MLESCQVARDVDASSENQSREELFSRFHIVDKLGEGSYGRVYKAVEHLTGEMFALKKIRIDYEDMGVPSTAIREVSLLKHFNHPNVIRLHDVFCQPAALYLVFEFLDMDLRAFIKESGKFANPWMLKSAAFQCTSGVAFCHDNRVLHRDLKPQNVLIDKKRRLLKLADFGLARAFTVPLRPYTHEVVTLWYRAPEILLGQRKYATPTDVWSLGCIIAEMVTGQALFPGDSEIDTLFRIFRTLGTPSDQIWPGVSTLADFKQTFPQWRDTGLAAVQNAGQAFGDDGIDMLRTCLRYNPVDRPPARRLLQHEFYAPLEHGSRALLGDRAADTCDLGGTNADLRIAPFEERHGFCRCLLCGLTWQLPGPVDGICPDCFVELSIGAPLTPARV